LFEIARQTREKELLLLNTMATKIQKLWRGYASRKCKFDYHSRKRYIQQITVKIEETRKGLREFEERQRVLEMERRRELERERIERLAGVRHHLLGTKAIPGVMAKVVMLEGREELVESAYGKRGGGGDMGGDMGGVMKSRVRVRGKTVDGNQNTVPTTTTKTGSKQQQQQQHPRPSTSPSSSMYQPSSPSLPLPYSSSSSSSSPEFIATDLEGVLSVDQSSSAAAAAAATLPSLKNRIHPQPQSQPHHHHHQSIYTQNPTTTSKKPISSPAITTSSSSSSSSTSSSTTKKLAPLIRVPESKLRDNRELREWISKTVGKNPRGIKVKPPSDLRFFKSKSSRSNKKHTVGGGVGVEEEEEKMEDDVQGDQEEEEKERIITSLEKTAQGPFLVRLRCI
jgi:hypothetical protein